MGKRINVVIDFLECQIEKVWNPTFNGLLKLLIFLVAGMILNSSYSWYTGYSDSGGYEAWVKSEGFGNETIYFSILFFILIVLVVWNELYNRKINERKQLYIISHLGLKDLKVGDITNFLPKKLMSANKQRLNVNYPESNKYSDIEKLSEQVRQILGLPNQIISRGSNERDADKIICYAGVAPTPMLVLAGFCISNMQKVVLADWYRDKSEWHFNTAYDDGDVLVKSHIPEKTIVDREISLAISLSYNVSLKHIESEFPNIPIYSIKFDEVNTDNLDSERKQYRIAKDILKYISDISKQAQNLNKINIFISAQASFNFVLGSFLNQAHLPELIVYNYDRQSHKKHSYGVKLSKSLDLNNIVVT